MASQRLLGQNVSLILLQNSTPLEEITCIKSFSSTAQLEMKEEGYLGETTQRFDSVFKGFKMDIELHTTSNKYITLVNQVISRARNRDQNMRMNLKAALRWPNGDRCRATYIDVQFGDIPLNVGSRTDYLTLKFDMACSEATFVLT